VPDLRVRREEGIAGLPARKASGGAGAGA